MGMTYVTLDTSEGPLLIPNSMLLAAGIGPRPDTTVSLDLTERVGAHR
jgi:hypothetical protein